MMRRVCGVHPIVRVLATNSTPKQHPMMVNFPQMMRESIINSFIDKLEGCLEEIDCVGTPLCKIVIILLLYVDDIVLMARCPYDLNKQLKILKDFCSSTVMTINIDKIIRSKKTIYDNFIYDNNSLKEVTSYKRS